MHRMVTNSKASPTGMIFSKAPNDSAFRKVYHNNMDKNSFIYSNKNRIASIIMNSKTAMFDVNDRIFEVQEYKNCSVSNIFICLLLYFIE